MAYDRERTVLLREYHWVNRMVLALADHPHLARTTVRLLTKTPGVFSHLLGAATGMTGLWPTLPTLARA